MFCRTYDEPGATLDQYDAVLRTMDIDEPAGVHVLIATEANDGLRVIEVLDSADAIGYVQSGHGGANSSVVLPQAGRGFRAGLRRSP